MRGLSGAWIPGINSPNNINGQLLLPWKIPFDPWLILSLYFGHIYHSLTHFAIHFERNWVFDQILGSILYLIFFWKKYFKQLAICSWLANLICATINQRRSFLNQILVRQNCTLEKLNHGNIKYIESNTPRRAPLVWIQDPLDWKGDSFYLLSIFGFAELNYFPLGGPPPPPPEELPGAATDSKSTYVLTLLLQSVILPEQSLSRSRKLLHASQV